MLLFALPMAIYGSPKNYNAAGAELLTRMFLTEIQPLLFPSNEFLARAKNDDAFVNYNSVELPNSGTIPNVAINRAVYPAPVAFRTDVATNYLLEELSTDPTHLQYSEELLVAYDKRASILQTHADAINNKAGIRALYKWCANITYNTGLGSLNPVRRATGSARAAGSPGATGNRAAITKADILYMRALMDSQNVPQKGRVMVVTPAFYQDLLGIQEFSQAYSYGSPVLPDGVLGKILGFDVIMRGNDTGSITTLSGTPVFDGSSVIKAEGAATATTDCQSCVFYQPDFVRRAKGAIRLFINVDRAEYQGSLFSAVIRFGAAIARNDNKGVGVVVEI